MPVSYTNQYATRSYLETRQAILALVQLPDGRIAGRYAYSPGTVPGRGWRFPADDAIVEGELIAGRTFPFENATDFGIRELQAKGPHGLQARLAIGGSVYYSLLLDYNSRSLILCDRDDVGAIPIPCEADFADWNLDSRNESQTSLRQRLLTEWLATESDPAIRAAVVGFQASLEAELATRRARLEAHLQADPRKTKVVKNVSGRYSYATCDPYTGEQLEASLELVQDGDRITGSYTAPSDIQSSRAPWDFPPASGPVTGEANRAAFSWHFETPAAFDAWKSEESSQQLPGGPLEARLQFGGETRYFLQLADGLLIMAKSDQILEAYQSCWPLPSQSHA